VVGIIGFGELSGCCGLCRFCVGVEFWVCWCLDFSGNLRGELACFVAFRSFVVIDGGVWVLVLVLVLFNCCASVVCFYLYYTKVVCFWFVYFAFLCLNFCVICFGLFDFVWLLLFGCCG